MDTNNSAPGMPAVTLPHVPRSMVDPVAPDYGGVTLEASRGVPMAAPAETTLAGLEHALMNVHEGLARITDRTADLDTAVQHVGTALASLRQHRDGLATSQRPADPSAATRPPATNIPPEHRATGAEGARPGVAVELPVPGVAVTATSAQVAGMVSQPAAGVVEAPPPQPSPLQGEGDGPVPAGGVEAPPPQPSPLQGEGEAAAAASAPAGKAKAAAGA